MRGVDIKNYRKKNGISQDDFAKTIGVSRQTLSHYENDGDIPLSKVKLLDIIMIDNKQKDVSDTLTNTNGNVFSEKEDGTFNIKVKLVPFEAYASYCEIIDDATKVYDWEEVTFNVEKYGRGNYMAFKVKGNSMNGGDINDTPSGAMVLARELGRQHWLDGFKPTLYGWIILSKTNIFHKDILNIDSKKGTITCHSRNTSPEYSDFELELNDIYQIFKVIKRTF